MQKPETKKSTQGREGKYLKAARICSSTRSRARMRLALGIALSWPCWVLAEAEFKPYTLAQYEHYTNLFEVSGRQEAINQNGSSKRAEDVLIYAAGLNSSFGFGQQKLRASGEVRRVNYDHFSDLDHNEHRFNGGLDWKLGSVLDGAFDYRQDRRIASFAELGSSELTLRRDEGSAARVGLQVTPVWRLETSGELRTYELPIPSSPRFSLDEKVGRVAIKYTGFTRLAAGIQGEYVDGEFKNVPDARTFEERSLKFILDYAIGSFSRINIQLGQVRREEKVDEVEPGAGIVGTQGEVSGFTGSLGFNRELSPKTSFNAQAYRQVDSYVVGANSLINTGLGAGLSWAPTGKTRFAARYDWTETEFQDEGELDGIGEDGVPIDLGRVDKYNVASFEMRYQALNWLSLRPFTEYRHRTSNFDEAEFKAFVGGLELRAGF